MPTHKNSNQGVPENMKLLHGTAIRFDGESWPPRIIVRFLDGEDRQYFVEDKIPIFDCIDPSSAKELPFLVGIPCVVIDDFGIHVKVDISRPCGLEATNGGTIFSVNEKDLKGYDEGGRP